MPRRNSSLLTACESAQHSLPCGMCTVHVCDELLAIMSACMLGLLTALLIVRLPRHTVTCHPLWPCLTR